MLTHRFGDVMKMMVSSVKQAGLLVRAVRRSQSLRQDDLAGSAGVGHVFVRDAERGKETIEFGRFLRLLDELGIRMEFDVPESSIPEYERLKMTGLKPLPSRRGEQAAKGGGGSSSGIRRCSG